MERRQLFAGPSGTRGVLFHPQGHFLTGAESFLAPKARSIGRAGSLLLECVDGCLKAGGAPAPLGFYAACDGNFYEAGESTLRLRDYGPKEFSSGFHSLWIYPAVNHLGATGPVLTFTDPDFGFLHACASALRDLERGTTHTAVVMHLYLQSRVQPVEEKEYLAGFVTSSSSWLTNVLQHQRQAGPRQGFADLFTGPTGAEL